MTKYHCIPNKNFTTVQSKSWRLMIKSIESFLNESSAGLENFEFLIFSPRIELHLPKSHNKRQFR